MPSYLDRLHDTEAVNNILLEQTGILAFDIGANGGLLSNYFATGFRNVVSVEPAMESYKQLARVAAPNVKPLNIAISDHNGEEEFRVTKLTDSMGELFTGESLSHWGETVELRTVPCMTLDKLADEYGMPDFVKIDTEGHEGKIIDGAHGVFETKPEFVIEIHDVNYGKKISSYFTSIGLLHRVIRHSAYNPKAGPNYYNHYWLVGTK